MSKVCLVAVRLFPFDCPFRNGSANFQIESVDFRDINTMKALFEKLVSFGKWLGRASLPVKAVAVIVLILFDFCMIHFIVRTYKNQCVHVINLPATLL